MAVYEGKNAHRVSRDGVPLDFRRSLKVRNHSPTGFSWGYGGSGPSQLALALLLDVLDDEVTAKRWYQRFMRAFVAQWKDGWTITSETILQLISRWEQDTTLQVISRWQQEYEEPSRDTQA